MKPEVRNAITGFDRQKLPAENKYAIKEISNAVLI
jgi:hypothetical protein